MSRKGGRGRLMKSAANPRFWAAYRALPEDVQRRARKAYRLWQNDPLHPSLRFKKVGRLWSARVDAHHRALADVRGDTAYWIWIGSHADYERLIAQSRK
jgi:hypothetical protein